MKDQHHYLRFIDRDGRENARRFPPGVFEPPRGLPYSTCDKAEYDRIMKLRRH